MQYYGEANADIALADTPTTHEELRAELDRLTDAGVTDVVLYPCTADLSHIERVVAALDRTSGLA